MEVAVVGAGLALAIMLGSFVSFCSQVRAIIKHRSSDGVSALSVQMCACSNVLVLYNIIILNIPAWYHTNKLLMVLPIAQIGLDVIYSAGIVALVQYFLNDKRRIALSGTSLAILLTCLGISLPLTIFLPELWLGRVFGLLAALCTALMWIPQIVCTYADPAFRDLSLFSVWLRFGGCFFDAIYKGAFAGEDWSVLCISGISMLFLVILLAVYYRAIYRAKHSLGPDPLEAFEMDVRDPELEPEESILGLVNENE